MVEAVIIHMKGHNTLCVSSQVGCRMACTFCATGAMGLGGNLSCGEIVGQLEAANQALATAGKRRIRNIVFMGMGEPLDNYQAVIDAIHLMVDPRIFGIGPSKITVSTVGVVPRMRLLSKDAPHVKLALSLHAPTQELRHEIVPTSTAWPLDQIMDALRDHLSYSEKSQCLIENILIKDVNCSADIARLMGQLLKPLGPEKFIVNLIPYNPTLVERHYEPPTLAQVIEYQNVLIDEFGLHTRTRMENGQEIDGACGQLALKRTDESAVAQKACEVDMEDLAASMSSRDITGRSLAPSASNGRVVRMNEQSAGSESNPDVDGKASDAQTDVDVNARPILILFASQTGCARDVAHRLGHELQRRRFAPRVVAFDAFEIDSLPSCEAPVIFVAATCGQGEMPDNGKTFWQLLRQKGLPSDFLSKLQFAVFGLGDSSYPKYNYVARKLYQRLLDLGGHELVERGLGDDQHDLGYDGALDPWIQTLLTTLMEKFPLPEGVAVAKEDELPPSRVEVSLQPPSTSSSAATLAVAPRVYGEWGSGAQKYTPCRARLLRNTRLTPVDHFQDTRHLVFDLEETGLTYAPGDVLNVHPENDVAIVSDFLSRAGLDRDARVSITPREGCDASDPLLHIPCPLTLGELFQRHLDVLGTPGRHFFEMLLFWATDEREVERLREFISPEGQADLYQYNQRERRTYAEVLQDFGSALAAVPLEWLIQLIPPLRPRQFSIASSLAARPGQAELLVALVDFETPHQRHKVGVCSQFLRSLGERVSPPVYVWVAKGSFRLPKDWLKRPVIFCGPGTGVAPFRSMLQERQEHAKDARRRAGASGDAVAPCMLFFGCRSATADYYYREEWTEMLADGTLSHVSAACSRDQERKVYVQHQLVEHGAAVWRCLREQGGLFLLAGSAGQMPKDVRAALLEVCRTFGKLDEVAAQQFLSLLDRTLRFQSETWS